MPLDNQCCTEKNKNKFNTRLHSKGNQQTLVAQIKQAVTTLDTAFIKFLVSWITLSTCICIKITSVKIAGRRA
jgi:hypothetical protein